MSNRLPAYDQIFRRPSQPRIDGRKFNTTRAPAVVLLRTACDFSLRWFSPQSQWSSGTMHPWRHFKPSHAWLANLDRSHLRRDPLKVRGIDSYLRSKWPCRSFMNPGVQARALSTKMQTWNSLALYCFAICTENSRDAPAPARRSLSGASLNLDAAMCFGVKTIVLFTDRAESGVQSGLSRRRGLDFSSPRARTLTGLGSRRPDFGDSYS